MSRDTSKLPSQGECQGKATIRARHAWRGNPCHRDDTDIQPEAVSPLLRRLDDEARQLPHAIRDRLALARRSAIASETHRKQETAERQTPELFNDREMNRNQPASQDLSQQRTKRYGEKARRSPAIISRFRATWEFSPFPAALMAISAAFAITTFLLVTNSGDPSKISIDSLAGLAKPADSSQAINLLAADKLPVITAEDDLDLYQSVDFLLWLESQPG